MLEAIEHMTFVRSQLHAQMAGQWHDSHQVVFRVYICANAEYLCRSIRLYPDDGATDYFDKLRANVEQAAETTAVIAPLIAYYTYCTRKASINTTNTLHA